MPNLSTDFMRSMQTIAKHGQLQPLLEFASQSGMSAHMEQGSFGYEDWGFPVLSITREVSASLGVSMAP